MRDLARATARTCNHTGKHGQIEYSSTFDSTKGYPGEGPNTCNHTGNEQIEYSSTFDSTKGYPGEGPNTGKKKPKPQQKKGKNRKQKTDKEWSGRLQNWGNDTIREIGAMTCVGDNLFMQPTHDTSEVQWGSLVGSIAHLNVRGWSNDKSLQRKNAWSQMADMRAMVISIVDHRKTKAQTSGVEWEVNGQWVQNATGSMRPMWVHAPAKTNDIGGVSLGIHPALKRYAHKSVHDTRGWGRWIGLEMQGKQTDRRTGKIVILATYGPTKGDGDNSMWQYQAKQMEKMQIDELQEDPGKQYVHDLQGVLSDYQESGTEVIIVGDTNINKHKNHAMSRKWNKLMEEQELQNWMEFKWTDDTHDIETWHNGENSSWIDHVWIPRTQLRDGILTRAGIEQVGGAHESDHAMIAAELNWSRMLGRTEQQFELAEQRQRTLMATNKEHAERYETILNDR